jgi:filamentous hemagglutinin
VAKAWDGQKLKEEVKAEAQITQAFSPMAAKEIGTYAGTKEREARAKADAAEKAGDKVRAAEFKAEAAKWAEGGAYRVALHTVAGGIAGGAPGALGAGASAAAADEIEKFQEGAQKYLEQAGMKSDSAKAIAKGVAGATAAGLGAVAGGTAGAVFGLNVDVNNRQLHPKEINWIKKNGSSFAKELSEKLGRPVSELEAQRWLTTAGESNVDSVYQRLASAEKGLSTSEESQAFNAAKQYIISNGKGSFVDDQGQTQQLFFAKNGDFYKPSVYSEYRNDKDYRDFYWEVKGDNLRPDNQTPEESATYKEREITRLKEAAKSLAVGAIPAVMAVAAGEAVARGGSASAKGGTTVVDNAATTTSQAGKNAALATKEVQASVDVRKFSDYIFKPGNDHGKDAVFKSLGYSAEDSAALAVTWEKQAAEKLAKGEYSLGKADQYGQRVDIEIVLPGKGTADGQTSYLRSGWMIQPDGSIKLNTPFSGFTRSGK